MRAWVMVVLAALPALAQAPSSFRSSAPLTVSGSNALHRLELPFEAYRDARADLADVRVFNAAGDAVPIAWAGEAPTVPEPATQVELPLFPVSRLPLAGESGTEVTVRAADGTLVAIRSKAKAAAKKAAPAQPAAWLLDASQLKEPVSALAFDWQAGPGTEMVTVRVEASEDLKAWSAVAAAPLVRLESAGRVLSQPRAEFAQRKSKYYRVSSGAPGFTLASVRAEHPRATKAPERRVQTAAASPGQKEGEHVYDLGARLPVEALRLVPPQENSVLLATLHARDDPEGAWRPVTTASFHRLRLDGVESASQPLEIGRHSARYWMARLAPGSSAGAPPALEAHWKGAALVFVAQGEGPYHLAFGHATAKPAALPVATLMPGYEKGAESRLPAASAGAVRSGPPPTRWDQLVGSLNPRRAVLWAVLFGGVMVLGFMAWRLSKQVR